MCDTLKVVGGRSENAMPRCQTPKFSDIMPRSSANDNYLPDNLPMRSFERGSIRARRDYAKSSDWLSVTTALCVATLAFFVLTLAGAI
jgi:hypothetical protein